MQHAETVSSPWIRQMREAVERREHAANVHRTRLGVSLGLAVWVVFGVADWALAHWSYSVDVWPVWKSRFGLVPLILVVLWFLWRTHPSPRSLTILERSVFLTVSASAGWNAAHLGGITSPYTTGAFLVMIARGVSVLEPWQVGLRANTLIAFVHVAALILSAWALPSVAAQFQAPGLVLIMLAQVAQLIAAIGIISLGSHTSWTLRRNVFEQRRVAHYRLLGLLGQGGQSEVWRAYDPNTGGDVAVKLSRSAGVDRRAFGRYAREVEVLSSLSIDEVVRVLDFGVTEEDVWYIVMERLVGVDLGQLVRDEGPLDHRRAARLCAHVATALAGAHARGVLHRDVKPENIFIVDHGTPRERAKLLDFGVASLTEQAGAHGLTRTGAVVGTPAFMSPQAAMGSVVDERADIYSFGASLFFALTGFAPPARPAHEGGPEAVTHQVQPDLSARFAEREVPPPLALLICQCLEWSPERRPASAAEIAASLTMLTGPRPVPDAQFAEPTQSLPGAHAPRREP